MGDHIIFLLLEMIKVQSFDLSKDKVLLSAVI